MDLARGNVPIIFEWILTTFEVSSKNWLKLKIETPKFSLSKSLKHAVGVKIFFFVLSQQFQFFEKQKKKTEIWRLNKIYFLAN